MDDLLRDFLTESNEGLSQLDRDIVELERQPDSTELINRIFRAIHTIKGTCGFLDLTRLERVAHATESVLVLVRERKLGVSRPVIDDVLAGVDAIKAILQVIETSGAEPPGTDAEAIARLEARLGGPTPAPEADASRGTIELFDTGEVIPVHAPPDVAPAAASGTSPAVPAEAAVPTASTGAAPSPAPKGESGDQRQGVADSSLRVNVVLLDKLMNLVGELVLGRNQLIQLTAGQEGSVFEAPVQHLNRVTTDLQEAVMKTRMQPVGAAWGKLPRLVRDLAAASGKQIELVMSGAETELDRQILQAIQDPLTHMVRNSADHGIEAPDVRVANGKGRAGTIHLNAFHEGGHVILEIRDDGAGINVDRVRQKAVERGLVKAEAAAALSEQQVLRFIFEPGFSTAAQVTNVSGRGVGMDVVRSNIERIGGAVELASRMGEGATVRIKIPLTLAIVSALVVTAGSQVFAIPQIGVVELVRVTEEQQGRVQEMHGTRFYRLRDTLLPLVDLAALLALNHATRTTEANIVVCQVGALRFGLVVDDVYDTQEIVVKPMGRLVKHVAVYSGCTILGDGRVIMILDPAGIAATAMPSGQSERTREAEAHAAASDSGERESVLLFDAGFAALQAVPLRQVARLEEFTSAQLEEADGRLLVQYRGALLPVIPANPAMDVRARDPRPVVVLGRDGQAMGLAVDEIRDIVEEHLKLEATARRPGVRGVGVIGGRATEVIDPRHFLAVAGHDLQEEQP
ncbi:MAG: chemotaxis protein CheA [Gemmatimonadetes bacterium]|nr:chemotaxis protein CheA [Gemmatimonadota bacterium]